MSTKQSGANAVAAAKNRSWLVCHAAVSSRVLLCFFVMVTSLIADDYDTSATCLQQSAVQPLDRSIEALLAGFTKWDAVYFLRISEVGYEFEQYYGFFPGYPLLLRLVAESILLPLSPWATLHSRLILAGVLVSNVAFVLAAIALYRLGCVVLNDEPLACTAALLFIINPASVFFSAIYTESVFALTSFAGMLFGAQDQGLLSAACFAGSSSIRGNGLVNLGFLGHLVLLRLARERGRGSLTVRTTATHVLKGLVYVAIALSPWALIQAYGYRQYCAEAGAGAGAGANAGEGHARPWCRDTAPLIYAFVQREYWANGFLAYYKVKNIPNFAIGLPIIALSFAAVADYMRRAPARAIASLGTAEARDPLSSYHSAAVFVHIVYLAALSLFGLCFMYIQCTTRFICASSPAVFWYTARTPGRTAAMVTYSLAFTAIGSVLFSNFYPWT